MQSALDAQPAGIDSVHPRTAVVLLCCRGRHVSLQVAAGLLYLHQMKILHLDLKSQ